jgi:hypothetical protein
MKNLSVFCSVFGIFIASSTLSAAPLKSTTVMHNVVRQCEYLNGVTIRILASRECPSFEAIPTPKPTPLAPPMKVEIQTQQTAAPISSNIPNLVRVPSQTSAIETGDVILDKSINRCTIIGFKKDTAEFRGCVTEQIKILSK